MRNARLSEKLSNFHNVGKQRFLLCCVDKLCILNELKDTLTLIYSSKVETTRFHKKYTQKRLALSKC